MQDIYSYGLSGVNNEETSFFLFFLDILGCASTDKGLVLKTTQIDLPYQISPKPPAIGENFTIEDARNYGFRIMEILTEKGFLNADLRWRWEKNEDGISFTLKADAKEQYKGIDIRIEGIKRFSPLYIKEHIFMDSGSGWDKSYPDRVLSRLLDLYGENGYLKVSLRLMSIEEKDNRLILTYKLSENYPIRLGNLEWKGLRRTNPSFLNRVADIRSGSLLTTDLVSDARERVYALGYFAYTPAVYIKEGKSPADTDLVMEVDELKTYLISGIISASPDSISKIIGNLDIRLGNLGGMGRNVSLYFLSEIESRLDIDYLEPRPFSIPFDIELKINRLRRPDIYTRFNGEARLNLYLSRHFNLITGFGIDKSISEEGSETSTDSLTNYSEKTFITGLGFKSLDHPFIPKRGFRADLENKWIIHTSKGNDSIPDDTSFRLRSDLKASAYLPLTRYLSYNLSPRLNWLYSNALSPDYYDWYDLGGLQGIRGLRPDAVRRPICLYFQQQLNLYPHPRLWCYPLFDIGYGFSHNHRGSEYYFIGRYTYGFGVRLQRQGLLLGLDYAMPIRENPFAGYLFLSATTLW